MPKQATAGRTRKPRQTAKSAPKGRTTTPIARTARPAMSDAWAVKKYLEAISGGGPMRRVRSPEILRAKIAECDGQLTNGIAPIKKLEVAQVKINLQRELVLSEAQNSDDETMTELRDGFIDAAPRYAERRGISYVAFRKVGVPREVLRAAGITS